MGHPMTVASVLHFPKWALLLRIRLEKHDEAGDEAQ
jgi:hypothetical protein